MTSAQTREGKTLGTVIVVDGPVFDARFSSGIPRVLTVVDFTDADGRGQEVATVVQQTGEGTVRCVAALERRHPAPGSSVRATGAGMLTPLRPAAVAGAMKVFAGTQERGGLLETGIKAVDLLCPYMQGGSVGLWGDIGAGELKLRTHPDDVGELPPDERGVWERARRVQNFLTQPMFMAEPYTKIPGRRVPLAQTLAGVKAILDGKADEVAEDSLLFVGALDDVKT